MADASIATTAATLVNVRASFAAKTDSITRRFVYDHAGRLQKVYHQFDAQPEVLLTQNEYNELGQLVDKKLHSVSGSAAKQSIDYRYNIRGWISSINNAALSNDSNTTNDETGDYFGMNLAYNTATLGIGNTAVYNGNISGLTWSKNLGLGTIKQNGYVYTYDPMSRLSGGSHKELNASGAWVAGQYDENGLTYDLNGNIKTLQRKGKGALQIDDLVYNYGTGTTASNKLLYIQDNTANTSNKAQGFADGNTGTATDYTYDANGNMNRDLNKGIGTTTSDATNLITYNFLNLPQTITKGGSNIRYIYDANGRKLTQVVTFGVNQKQTDYAGEFIYENDVLQFVNHEEGRIAVSGNTPIYFNRGEEVNTAELTAVNTTLATASANGENYVTATATATTSGTGIFPIAGTLTVTPGERYRIRAKGYRTTSNIAYLRVTAGGIAVNTLGAVLPTATNTETWVEQIVTIPAGITTLQAGVVWSTATVGDIIYLNDFEITKLETITPEYQYYMKDHLGNTRLTFTSKTPTTTSYAATFETGTQATEEANFENYSSQTFDLVDHTDAGTTYQKVQTLNGGVNGRVGLAKSIPVGVGDEITITAYGKYMNLGTTTNSNALITSLAAAFGVSSSSTGEALRVYNGLNTYASTVPAGDHVNDNEGAPKAFVTILFFDKDYNLVNAAWDQMTTTGLQSSATVKQPPHDELSITAKAPEAGYAYVFLSNEHPTFVDVYFDDVNVSYTPSPVIAADDYYPFGLTYNSYLREKSNDQDYLYNGKEQQNELGLGWLDYGARMYEPEAGRWFIIDPSANDAGQEKDTPYGYVANNPVSRTDPDGKIWSNLVGAVVGAAVEYGSQVAGNIIENGLSSDAFTKNIDVGDIAVAAAEGFLTSGTSAVKNVIGKAAIKGGAELLRNAVDIKDGKISINSVKSTLVNTGIGLLASKVGDVAPAPKGKLVNAPTPKDAVKQARLDVKGTGANVTRADRINIQTSAKKKMAEASSINETLNKAPGALVAGSAGETSKRKSDKNLR